MESHQNHREENIKLTIKTKGIFKILRPVFKEDELYDSELLEEKVISLINDGARNILIDLSNVDYLYSDSINTFVELNRRIINVWGRIALYSPNENLSKILKRSGIEKFLNIYSDEKEIENATSKIIEQTSSLTTEDIKNYKTEKEKKIPDKINNVLSIQHLVQSSSRDLALFEIQSFKNSLNAFYKDVLDPLYKKIEKIEKKLLNETNTTQKTSEEVPQETDLQDDKSSEKVPLTPVLKEEKLSEEIQSDDEQNDIQRIVLEEKPDFTNLQKEEKTLFDSKKEMVIDDTEEFYLEDNL